MEKYTLDDVVEKPQKSMMGKVKDTFDDIKENISGSLPEKKKDNKPESNFKRDLKRQKRKELWLRIKNIIAIFLDPDTYAEIIQKFETLLSVIFIDTFYVLLLFSIVYGVYIIINFDSYEIPTAISKFVGAIIVSIICIIVQINVHSKSNKT